MKLQKFPLDNQTCVVNIGSCMLNHFLSLFFSLKKKKDLRQKKT
jgi:hypothetical protein